MKNPPQISDLLARFLAEAPSFDPVPIGEVELFDAVPAQAVDASAAWASACESVALLAPKSAKAARPSDWPNWVASRPALTVVLFAAGSYPQAVRDVNQLLKPLAQHQPGESSFTISHSNEIANQILHAGLLRESGRWNEAEKLLDGIGANATDSCVANEKAALLFARSQIDEAIETWTGLPESAPKQFNLGVAALIQGRNDSAQSHFTQAVKLLPETSPWHHLAQLYLAVAGMKR